MVDLQCAKEDIGPMKNNKARNEGKGDRNVKTH
jgi:hypothetical protein